MAAHTHDLLASFGGVEDDQRYTRLVENFTDDATYYDPFFGAQIGKPAIHDFMTHMEEMVPASGARFAEWRVSAGTDCGYAEWIMVARNSDGIDVAVPGESLYRLRDGKVLGVVDYVDPVAYTKLRGAAARAPRFVDGNGSMLEPHRPTGKVADEIRQHVEGLRTAGRWPGSAELIDHAGDGDVGWAQWLFNGPHGSFAGWSLRSPSGHVRDLFDTVTAHKLSVQEKEQP